MTEDDVGDIVVPLEVTQSKLKACMSCSLVKTTQQFFQYGCENCPFMGYEGDRERVGACTTSSFIGTYVVINPKRSWVSKWQRVGTLWPVFSVTFPEDVYQIVRRSSFVPGAYAISIEAKMPDDIVEQLEENRMRMHSVLATADKPET